MSSGRELHLYRLMRLIRDFENRVEQLHIGGRLRGSFHSSVGQESSAAGVCAVLKPEDVVTTTHRGHGHALAKGVPSRLIMAELFGKATGTSGGRGGSMHLHHKPSGFLGQNAIVGGGMPWAAGAAWARRQMGFEQAIGVSFTGDGAFGQGVFYETIRLAVLWSSPCLFVCENNELAHSMPTSVIAGEPGSIAAAVSGLGIQAAYVDGRDPVDVLDAAGKMVEVARSGRPVFLECRVFRVRPHSLSDPDYRYRERDAGEQWLKMSDPLRLLRNGLTPKLQSELDEIDAAITSEIDSAVDWAESQPDPLPVDIGFQRGR